MQYIANNKSESQVHDRGMSLFIFKVDIGVMPYCQHVCIFHYQTLNIWVNKLKNRKYHTIETVLKSSQIILFRSWWLTELSVIFIHANPIWITKLQSVITLFMSASCIEFSPYIYTMDINSLRSIDLVFGLVYGV